LRQDKLKDMHRKTRLAGKISAPASVAVVDQDVFECPVCCEPLKIPIYQCVSGHLACTPCWERIENICPSCQKLVGRQLRCRAMEKVLEVVTVSCPYAIYGCKEIISYANLSRHEEMCLFAHYSCPMGGCNYTGFIKDLHKHVRDNHKPYASLYTVRNTNQTFFVSFVLNFSCVYLHLVIIFLISSFQSGYSYISDVSLDDDD
ncbi:hypothetical protein CARUB_v10019102mg, partial [Capsella rubella]